MATNSSLKNQIANKKNSQNQVSDAKQMTLKSLLSSPAVQKRFETVLEEKSSGFTTSLLNMVNGDPNLAEAQPMSIITSAMVAATLDLPIDKNLGYAYIVPFRDWKKGNEKVAQFQLGYKGYIQLAQRSGQYLALNVTEVYAGELKSWNRLTESFEFDPEGKESDEVIGYVAYFRLVNGFEKTVYWTKQQVESHRIKHNKAKNKEQLAGVWKSDYDAMAQKTVLKMMLSKWGILSIEMQKAVTTDETVQEMDEKGELKQAEMIEDDEPEQETDGSPIEISEDEATELFKGGTITPNE